MQVHSLCGIIIADGDEDEDDGAKPWVCLESDYLQDRAYDWLEADDPALFSDEFSEPEEWGIH